MALIMRIPGVTINNPNLPTLVGVDVDKKFGSIFLDFGTASLSPVGEWNNVPLADYANNRGRCLLGVVKDITGAATNVSIDSQANFLPFSTGSEGSLVYPSNVSIDGVYIGGEDYDKSCEIYINGLSKKRLYNLEVFASRVDAAASPRISYYSANGRAGQLDAINNDDNVLVLSDVAADENGQIKFTVDRRESLYAYLSSLKIIEA
jgi:hypothetical protein